MCIILICKQKKNNEFSKPNIAPTIYNKREILSVHLKTL